MSLIQDAKFGTSGLRGPVGAFTPQTVYAYTEAFLGCCCTEAVERTVLVGIDLRASSPFIAATVVSALAAQGWKARFAGAVPTPALAAYAVARRLPAIMVTGSHVPDAYNGLKFYRPDGEMLKTDEMPVRERAQALLEHQVAPPAGALPEADPEIGRSYTQRYTEGFSGQPLAGVKAGVWQHSAVGRDGLVSILTALGAECICFGRVEGFVAVDTEALEPAQTQEIAGFLASHSVDAVVSTDGDGDRPLIVDETGNQIAGDVLGALTARALGSRTVVTPLTSTSAVELSGWFEEVMRTRVGSPHVVEMLAGAGDAASGFEANGGFLLGHEVSNPACTLSPLVTRDAVLPIVTVLAKARRHGLTLSTLAEQMPQRFMRSGRVGPVSAEAGRAFLVGLATSVQARAELDPALAAPRSIDTRDGVRMMLEDDTVIHMRQSGNAPEMRCYVETQSLDQTGQVLETILSRLAGTIKGGSDTP